MTGGIGIGQTNAQDPGSKSKKVKSNGTVKKDKVKKDGKVIKSDSSIKETKTRPDESVKKEATEYYTSSDFIIL